MYSDKRNYESGYDSWPKYNVARAASKSLRQFENLPEAIIRDLYGFVDRGRDSSDDVVVHAIVLSVLAQNSERDTLSRLISGLTNPWHIGSESSFRYPIRIAAARGVAQLLLRPDNIPLGETEAKEVMRASLGSDVRVAAPALMAGGFRADITFPVFVEGLRQNQTPLLRLVLYGLSAAASWHPLSEDALGRILPKSHPIREVLRWENLQEATSPSPDVLNWIATLKSSRSVERGILYLLSQIWKLPIESAPNGPWDEDNYEPKEIPVLTLRSMIGGE